MRAYPTNSESGFSLLEALFALSILTLILVTVGMGVHSAALSTREMQERFAVQAMAQTFLDTILAVPFGSDADPDPAGGQISEVFDLDATLGDITLHQLRRWPAVDRGWTFVLGDFPVEGVWRIQVDHDLDDDGGVGTVAAASFDSAADIQSLETLESSRSVFRIRVFFNDRLILATNRAMEVSQ
jgi:hypothetical protein